MRCNSGDSGRSVLGRVRLPFGRPGVRRSTVGVWVRAAFLALIRLYFGEGIAIKTQF